jgi:hypothetical protein
VRCEVCQRFIEGVTPKRFVLMRAVGDLVPAGRHYMHAHCAFEVGAELQSHVVKRYEERKKQRSQRG